MELMLVLLVLNEGYLLVGGFYGHPEETLRGEPWHPLKQLR
ncbi:hypothetical protein CXB51_034158 [Gossypium anomalum]|uniref:Uncharacterized protein n=1 Tax=Gossypium anomalum TaxID=47600 RepID=A0A8J5YPJ1_9ROSI|nr:hypothetical protein CXB51_034158 [Gossypium anomalum]